MRRRYVRYPFLYVYQTLCKSFSLLPVLVSIIILLVSYKLFRWFYSTLPSEGVCSKLPMYYGMTLIDSQHVRRVLTINITMY